MYTKSRKFPKDLPRWPSASCGKEWTNWADFLGTDNKKGGWLEFRKARAFARNSGIKSGAKWKIAYKNNKISKNIPANPNSVYKRAGMWKGWADFLGTRNQKGGWMSFTDARKHVRKLKFQTRSQYLAYVKSGKASLLLPAYPDSAYKNKGWKGWPDFLGTDYVPPQLRQYRSFEKARKFARSLKLKSAPEWVTYCKSGKKPKDIPSAPRNSYKKEWKDWGDWLGTGNLSPADRKKGFKSFEESREFVRSLGVKTEPEWRKWMSTHKKPIDIPANPEKVYKDQWTSMGDWFGTGRIADKFKRDIWLPLKQAKPEARRIAKKLGITTKKQWLEAHRAGKIPNLPLHPDSFYNRNRKRSKKK